MKLGIDRFDVIGFVGFGLFVYGISRLNLSAAFIVAGAVLSYFGFVMSGRRSS